MNRKKLLSVLMSYDKKATFLVMCCQLRRSGIYDAMYPKISYQRDVPSNHLRPLYTFTLMTFTIDITTRLCKEMVN